VIASVDGAALPRDKMLITHRGLSGAGDFADFFVLATPASAITLDLAPGRELAPAVQRAKYSKLPELVAALQGSLPRRFAERWVELHEPESLSNAGLEKFEAWKCMRGVVLPADTRRLRKGGSTAGGGY